MSHRLETSTGERLLNAVPFGLGRTKPKHFRDMADIVWRNRDNLGYAWKVLSRGVCDGCALGVAGLHDWTIEGVHLCMTRLNLLRLNTMPAMDPAILADVTVLRGKTNAELRELGRLPFPMIREAGDRGFRRVTWEEALGRIGGKIRVTDPRKLAFFVTARGVTNEVYYMAQKAARFLGTGHVDNAARLCHAPSTSAMKHAIGLAASTCSYRDWYGTDLIVFFGANPANDQPVTTKYLHEARALGTRVALVNPYLEPGLRRYWVPSSVSSAVFGTGIADWWFPVTQGGDIAFISGVLKILIARNWVNREFIESHAADFPALQESLERMEFAELEKSSGLSRASMEEFAELLHRSRNAVFVWSMGITQHSYGGDAVSAVLNLGLAMGYVGREKTGLMPIRGHSSVQGGAEMGCYSTALPGGKPLTEANVAALSEQYGFPVPGWAGMTAVDMVEACANGELDVFYNVGGNFLRTLPDPNRVARALENVPLRIHQDILVTDQMLLPAREAVILLPAKTRYEQDDGGIETTTERRIAYSPEIPRQVGEARAEWKILRDVAVAAFPERASQLGAGDGWELRREIARIVPFYEGCQDLSKTGDAVQYGGPRLCDGGVFATPDGRAHFKAISVPGCAVEGPANSVPIPSQTGSATSTFVVSTRRGKQFNTLIYAEVDPLTGAGRDAVFLSPSDASVLGISQDDPVLLSNGAGQFEGRAFLAPIAPGNLQVHWPEGNVLLRGGLVDSASGVPDYNAVVTLSRRDSTA